MRTIPNGRARPSRRLTLMPAGRASLRAQIAAVMVVLLASVLAVPLAASSAVAIGESTFTNPIEPDTADPTIEYSDGNYYMVATTWDNHVVMRKAPTLAALGTTKPVTVYSDTNAGRNGNMWAPELQRLNGPNGWRWYLMYTMGASGDFGSQRLQVIESAGDDPMGPYTYKARPLATDAWNIDGAYMELNGELFMTWSMFAPDGLQSNYISRMSNPWTATGPMNLLSQPVEDWEVIGQPVNEGPIPLHRDGKTWIVYSASFCGTEDYQLGTLEYVGGNADPVLASSWVKSEGPVFSKANGEYGAGHNDFFESPDGTETWNLYHANARPDGGCSRERSARAHIVDWTAEGEPDFGTPLGTSAQIPVPSGENAPITARVEGGSWNLINRTTGLCATVSSSQSGDGAGLVQGSCSTPRANWKLDTTGDNFVRVVNASSGKALKPAGCTVADGTAAQQGSWQTTSCQQWSIANRAEGYSTLTNRTSGKLLDAGTGAAGAIVSVGTGNSSAGQDWVLMPSGAVAVGSVASGKVFDIPSCSAADGAALQQREFVGAPCQRVTFSAVREGGAEIHPVSAPAKCLAVTSGSTADGATVTQGACGVTGSAWRVLPKNDGTVEFRAVHSGKALDLDRCLTNDGAKLGQWTALNNDCQLFRVMTGAVEATVPLQLQSTASTRCVAGKAVVTVTVKNEDDLPADVTVTTAYGTKTFTGLGGGKTVSAAFTTRQAVIAGASATSAGAGADDAARTASVSSTFAGTTCR
ncbi:MAG TPA: family 43 glycosylhydrolase [Glaciibacter sp.]|nr:family 43 glycosylhydrolase [Glaciibacter sp.]